MGTASNLSKVSINFFIFFLVYLFFNDVFVNGKPFKEKLTHLHFYFHDVATATNPTVVQVAAAPNSTGRIRPFGSVMIADDPLTETPNPSSKLLGKAQGLYSSVSQSQTTYLMAFNFVFMEGKYNGSTLSIFGRNSILSKVREIPIIGGTGVFRFARGYTLARTYAVNSTTFNAIVEYDVHVLHY